MSGLVRGVLIWGWIAVLFWLAFDARNAGRDPFWNVILAGVWVGLLWLYMSTRGRPEA